MKKDKYAVFELSDYPTKHRECIEILCNTYPDIKWFQLLSPYHCFEIFYELVYKEDCESIYDVLTDVISRYSKISVYLDYAFKVCLPIGNIQYKDVAVRKLLATGEDADKLAMQLLLDRDIETIPMREHIRHNNEVDNENYILRDMFTWEAMQWCLEYEGHTVDTVNVVDLWNRNKKAYFKYLKEESEL